MKHNFIASLFGLLLLTAACRTTDRSETPTSPPSDSTASGDVAYRAPEWARNAAIYEVNTRQFSAAGTLKAVELELPRIKELGADIIWLMPIYPISKTNSKGSLGSPYAVSDYKAVNPDYGTINDVKALVTRAHALGMHVILDWVPNHTGWNNAWIKEHPDWYTQVNGKVTSPLDEKGKPIGWADVADLNYANKDMRKAMLEALQFWVKECDIDGYRCDVAGMVPDDFWAEVRPALDKIKPMFMLAENEDDPKEFKVCFNMNYGWAMHTTLKAIAKGTRNALSIDTLVAKNRSAFPQGYYQMLFTQNHDENTWNGTLTESFGAGADAFIVLTHTLAGMPLVYNGMESNLNRRLQFFEKDPINWGTHYPKSDFFKALLTLKHRNRALWNGNAGGEVIKIPTNQDEKVYAFYRQKDEDRVAVVVNLSDQPQTIQLNGTGYEAMYTDVFSRQPMELKLGMSISLKPWEYRVLTN